MQRNIVFLCEYGAVGISEGEADSDRNNENSAGNYLCLPQIATARLILILNACHYRNSGSCEDNGNGAAESSFACTMFDNRNMLRRLKVALKNALIA